MSKTSFMKEESEETFTVDEIEDVRIIIKARGKHFGIVPKTGMKEQADLSRIAMLTVLFDSHFVVSKSLESLNLK